MSGAASICGRMFGPTTEAPQFCVRETGHDGECSNRPLCGAKLGSIGKVFVCELESGHIGKHHRGFPEGGEADRSSPTFWTDDAVGAVLPSETDETPPEAPEAASGAQDEPEEAETEEAEEEIVQTAPHFPVELVISSSLIFIQRLPHGGRQIKVVPARPGPGGPQVIPPAYVLEFPTGREWDTFKKILEDDGKPKPQIVTATHLPPGVVI